MLLVAVSAPDFGAAVAVSVLVTLLYDSDDVRMTVPWFG
jgi:hypothetical protein